MALNPQTRISLRQENEALTRERLRQALPATVVHLKSHQAGQIDAGDIDEYVKLNWLEWHGGGLRLTITGRNVWAQTATAAT
jgi:hypothetical protein